MERCKRPENDENNVKLGFCTFFSWNLQIQVTGTSHSPYMPDNVEFTVYGSSRLDWNGLN
jgi:hypothetical protein